MNDAFTTKHWKVAETMLFQASEFLHDPKQFSLEEQEFADYRFNSRSNELIEAMYQLETIALNQGAKSGFWRRLKKVAEHLEFTEKVNQYETRFHEALSGNSG